MKVYYAIFYPILHFILASLLIFLLALAFFLVDRTPLWFEIVFISVLLIRGFLFFKLPYFELRENQLIIFNRLGGSFKKYSFNSIKDFHWEEDKLFVLQKGKSVKVKVSKVFVSAKNWKNFKSLIRQANLGSELH